MLSLSTKSLACVAVATAFMVSGALSAKPSPRGKPAQGRTELAPPGVVLPRADGKIDAEIRPADGSRDASSRLRFDLDGLAPRTTYTLWGDDPATQIDTSFDQFASVTSDDKGRARLEFDTARGDSLPFGATLVGLGGQAVRVRSGGEAVLAGEFPAPGGPGESESTSHGRGDLDPPNGAAFPGAVGRFTVEAKSAHGNDGASSKLRIQVWHLARNAQYTLWSDDPTTPADPARVQFGTMSTNGGGNTKIDFDTKKGAALPFGATLRALEGYVVEVRDSAGAVALVGPIPAIDSASPQPKPRHGHSDLHPATSGPFPGAFGRIETETRPARGRNEASSRLKIDVERLAPNTQFALWGDDPFTPVDTSHVQFGTLTTDSKGRAHFDVDTRRGAALPFGATLAGLGGRSVQIRDGGDVILVGVFPGTN